ncbi:BZ3500_MvSof-1268-A1-R1_Chr2-2g04946 [Microbotryum saponariae]|uniref:BZ3500_MvSof-1268-A1-R1_Chr2-2g04946 protein n=1 Tax=Microbotryum saponariae TaxID=289078 RepID=A0A2X0M010_9BASI|nr:BZ3500_MvSof-1268-A1-R1_Chr2-2g04946 [Microbotryum saponariae]SDA00537.1 BZ3501_MvSof-1269-A2-R1_Chr2-2g04620 [Microbotryum saponariae]
MPPSPPSPRRNLSKSITRNIPAGCKEVPWVEEEDDLSFWSPPTCCPSDHPLGTSSISTHAGEQQSHGDASAPPLCPLTTTAPPLCPLASPPPSPHRKALTLPVAPPAPPATLAREPSSALKLKSTASSSSGRRSSRARPERRSTGDSRGRGREPGSSLDRRRVTSRSPPRRTSMGGSLKISKSMLSATCSLGRREETLWPRPFDEASPEDPRSSSPVVSDEEDDDDSDEYDARFVDLAVIRRSLPRQGSQSPHKPTSSLQTHPMIDGLSNDPHASASPPRRRHRRLEKLHSEQWFLFAVAGAKEQRTGLGYWSHFDFDLS